MFRSLFYLVLTMLVSASSFAQQTVDLYIMAGQSNTNGRGLVSNLTSQQKVQAAMFYGSWHKFTNNASAADINPQLFSGWRSQTIAGETRNNGNISETFGTSPRFGPEVGFGLVGLRKNLGGTALVIF